MDEDIMLEKIREYKASLKEEKPDLDFELFLRILDMVNEDSEVKVAIDPVDPDGNWSREATTYAVVGIKTLDDGRLSLVVRDERHGISAGDLEFKLHREFRRTSPYKVPVLFKHKGEVIQLTEIYAHSLVREAFAGMPTDVVLATKQS